MTADRLRVHVYCGYFVGAAKWQTIDCYEPDECCWEDVIEVDATEWDEGCVSVDCPRCHNTLWQGDDHFAVCEDEGAVAQ